MHDDLARQKAEAVFHNFAPQAEMKLGFLAKQLEDLDTELAEAGTAMNSAAIGV